MEYACGVKFSDVSISEGWGAGRDAEVGVYRVRIEPAGWTLIDMATPAVERHWAWEAIGAIESTPGATTPDGTAAVRLDIVVNGWPVGLVFPAAQLPASALAHIRAMAPAHVVVRCRPDTVLWAWRRRLTQAARAALGALAPPLRRRVAIGTVAAMTAGVVVGVVGLAFGAGGATPQAAPGPVTRAADGGSSTTGSPGTTDPAPALAPASSAAPSTAPSTTARPSTKTATKTATKTGSRSHHGASATPVVLNSEAGPPSSESGPATTAGPASTTTKPAATTTTTTRATTTTRPRPPPTTRPRPTTTVAPTTTAPPPTTAPTTPPPPAPTTSTPPSP